MTQSEALVQVDFAENYTCKYQDEVQSAHWHQQQITLFSVAVWTNNGSETTCKSHVIVTDELSHEKKSVAVMMSKFHSLQPLENGLIRCRTYSIQSTWEGKGRKEQSDTDSEESLSDLS